MKIDSQRASLDVNSTDASRRIGTDRGGVARTTDRAAVDRQDKVEVSADAKLLTAALKATSDMPAIRQDAVERAKAKLAAGDVGRDSGRLADRLIDTLLKP